MLTLVTPVPTCDINNAAVTNVSTLLPGIRVIMHFPTITGLRQPTEGSMLAETCYRCIGDRHIAADGN